ncbi:MAG: hypothetical protein KGZ57_02680 [Dethiobacter sp.]|nr:hypothetical protein [Dethiobacter sp.]
MKKGLIVILVLSLVFAGGVWASPAITLIVNGQRATAEVRVINGVSFLPLRAVAELLGVPVHWDGKTRTITVGTRTPVQTPVPVTPPTGTRQNPIPIGTQARVGQNWNVTVLEINSNAWDIVRATNQFNEPPVQGHHFVMARVRVSYVGTKSESPWIGLNLRYLGADGITYRSGIGVIPNSLSDIGEMFPGAVAEGNIGWSVPITAIFNGTIIVEESFQFPVTPVFFAVLR